MKCPQCGGPNPESATRCQQCGHTLTPNHTIPSGAVGARQAPDPDATVAASRLASDAATAIASPTPHSAVTIAGTGLSPNVDFGPRYRVEKLLGEGGMGAVYKAYDLDLQRTVALKLIRPHIAADPEVSQRFRQELLLASRVSHKNILRIHDLGEANGTKFISMAFVEGEDLYQVLRRQGRLPIERALTISRQLCSALDAAHSEGVLHRDLKPQNILLDTQDHVFVSDFGLAKSLDNDAGLSRTGEFLGTPRYMSPEQVECTPLDQRSDLYALGLVMYEMVTGDVPFHAATTFQMMMARVREIPADPKALNPDLPEWFSAIILKCLERDPVLRYQSATEVLADIDRSFTPALSSRSITSLPAVAPKPVLKRAYLYAALVIMLLIGAGTVTWRRLSPNAPSSSPSAATTSIAFVPFQNRSDDTKFDWLGASLAEMLGNDLSGSPQVRVVPADRIAEVTTALHLSPTSSVDESTLKRIAEFTGATRLVFGTFTQAGDQIRLDAILMDVKQGTRVPVKVEAASEKELLNSVQVLANQLRQRLEETGGAIGDLGKSTGAPITKSLDALHHYNEGMQRLGQGNNLEAQKDFETATTEDPAFALAYSRLGQTYSNLGYDDKAEKASHHAVELSEQLSQRDKYLIAANYARVTNNAKDAIQFYENLARISPGDVDVLFTLGSLYEANDQYDPARDDYQRVLNLDPKNAEALLARGRVEIKKGNPQGSLEFLTSALSIAIQLDNQEEKASILQATGIAYKELGKLDEALRNYQESLAIKRAIGQKKGIGSSLDEIAQVQFASGQFDAALQTYQQALAIRREIGDKNGIGNSLVDLGGFYHDRGQHDKALPLFREALQIERELGNESYEALCLNNIGSSYYYRAQFEDALAYFQQALQLREKMGASDEIAETLHNLAETNLKVGDFQTATAQYLRALELRKKIGDKLGAATESIGMSTMFVWQARYGAAVDAGKEAAEAFAAANDNTFLRIEALGAYGTALAESGQFAESDKPLQEALTRATDLKNEPLQAQSMIWQAQSRYLRGEYAASQSLFQKALALANRIHDKERALSARVGIAKCDVAIGKGRSASGVLAQAVNDAETQGQRYLALAASIENGKALTQSKAFPAAEKTLTAATTHAERLGLRMLAAQGHAALANAELAAGHTSDASSNRADALRLIESIAKEPGGESVPRRSDVPRIA